MSYDDLSFFGETLATTNAEQQEYIVKTIQETLQDPSSYELMLDRGSWDVLGVRFDGSMSGITGGNLSGDLVWNFNSRELSALININGTIGLQFGTAGAFGLFLGYNAPDNSVFKGWGSGLTFGGAFGPLGGTVQMDSSGKVLGLNEQWRVKDKIIGATLDDPYNLTVMYSGGTEAELSYSVGYTFVVPLNKP